SHESRCVQQLHAQAYPQHRTTSPTIRRGAQRNEDSVVQALPCRYSRLLGSLFPVVGLFDCCVEAICAIRWLDTLTQAAPLLGRRPLATGAWAGYPVTDLPF